MLRLTALVSLLLFVFARQISLNLNQVAPPAEWLQLDRVNPQEGIILHFGLKQQNLDILERTLFEVSDPRSPRYGQHKTFDEINQMVAPRQETIAAVYNWLKENGIKEEDITFTANRDFLRVETSIETAERLLATQYHNFEHVRTGYKIIRVATSYSLPEQVRGHIDFVGPTTRFPRMQSKDLGTIESIEGLGSVDPSFLRTLYNVGSYSAQSPKTQQCVTGFLEQYVSLNDLGKFLDKYSPSTTRRNIEIVGPNVLTNPGIEAMLDIEYVMAMGLNVNSSFWYTAGRAPNNKENEPFLQFLFDVSNATNPPQVFSISYGDNEDTVDLDYATRINAEFQKLGARGISFLASSGDGGVGGSQPTACTQFKPTFPAGSPYVTAVGGTTGSNERAASLSGGGFSNYWDRPSYQTSFVNQYFSVAKNLPNKSLYNNTGAGFPDVSAQAEDFLIVWRGFTTPVSGTSCSSPTFAGIVALLNDVRLAAGKSTLGYLNPLFYQNPGAFNDITEGNNPGCSTSGFYAAPGWDPVTGLGTPNFQKLSQIVSNLP